MAFSYWLNTEKVKEILEQNKDTTDSKTAKDSLFLKIYDGDKLVRTLQREIPKEEGIYRWRWYMDAKGGSWIRRNPRTLKQESGGGYLRPGQYQAELSFGTNDAPKYRSNKRQIMVNADPRVQQTSPQGEEKIMAMMEAAKNLNAQIISILKQIKADLDGLGRLEKDLKREVDEVEGTDHKVLLEEIETLNKSLTELQDLYVGKRDKRQGITAEASPSVADRIRLHYGYLRSRPNGPTQTETQLWEQAKQAAETAQQKVNEFYSTTWPGFAQKISEISVPYFRPKEMQKNKK